MDEVRRQPVPHNLRTQAHDLHVVVLHGLVSAVDVVDDGGADARDLVARDNR